VNIERRVSELTYAYLSTRVWPSDERRRVVIITFNYDLVAETMLDGLNVGWDYGTLSEQDDERPRAKENVTLLKLHGSINWCKPRERAAGQLSGRLKTYKTYEGLLSDGETPLIIPPTWQKSFGDVLGFPWDDAVKALNDATRIGIFGFSLPSSDTHVKYLLAAGLRNNISLRRLAFVTKDATGPIERLWRILRPELYPSQVSTADSDLAGFVLGGGLATFLGLPEPELRASSPSR
jgi:hypothetical protein